ncbi:hypothetical protein GLA29479_2314 [Lysobacter antibioticus]|nr:hypothetical protein GLA29479_2314 [Lysobacter antibioticus]
MALVDFTARLRHRSGVAEHIEPCGFRLRRRCVMAVIATSTMPSQHIDHKRINIAGNRRTPIRPSPTAATALASHDDRSARDRLARRSRSTRCTRSM